MRRVLLTGAGGFVGRACIAPLLARGFEVHALARAARPWPAGVVGWQGDLLDVAALPGLLARIAPTHLLHAAWDVTHGAYWTAPFNLAWLEAGVALLRAFQAAGGQRAVGVGSCAEYAWTADVLAEDGPAAAATPYGRCKRALGDAFAAAGGMGLSTAWARLFFPYGPGEQGGRLLPSLMAALRDGRPFPTTAGTQRRDFVFVGDVGEALAALLGSEVAGAVNIGRGEGVALREVVGLVAEAMGRPDLVRFGALPIRPGDPPALVADVGRLAREVGYGPPTGLREGLALSIAAFRAGGP